METYLIVSAIYLYTAKGTIHRELASAIGKERNRLSPTKGMTFNLAFDRERKKKSPECRGTRKIVRMRTEKPVAMSVSS